MVPMHARIRKWALHEPERLLTPFLPRFRGAWRDLIRGILSSMTDGGEGARRAGEEARAVQENPLPQCPSEFSDRLLERINPA